MLSKNSHFTGNGVPGRGVYLDLDRTVYRSIATASLFCLIALSAFGQTSIVTQHNDNSRTGQDTTETILNTTNVNVNQFGKLFALPTDGQVYAQPLYVAGVTINGTLHNVLIVATEGDSVYAFDADSNSAPLWKASLVDAAHGAGTGEKTLNSSTATGCSDLLPQIGITSTPVIDATSNTIYVEAKSTNGSSYFHRLHALDLLTGNEKSPGPVQIAATVAGTGDGSTNGQLVFDSATMSLHQQSRAGLLLMNGTIYISFASHCDFAPYHGWLFAYDAASFARKSVYVTTPNGGLGGFWMSGAGIAGDSSGNIYIPSGNGDFDAVNIPSRETGDTLLKLGSTSQILTLLDYFTPHDQDALNRADHDLGSGGALLLPDQPGSFPHILVQAGKEGRIYVLNRDQLTTGNTHYCSGCANDTEIIEESSLGAVGSMFSAPAYWNNNIYFWGSEDLLKSIPVTNGLPDFTHLSSNSTSLGFPGATPSISSNGTAAGSAILWAINSSQYGAPGPGPAPAVLYAYDATNVSKQLWSSVQSANNRDKAGNAVKFSTPTISNGKVYVGTSTEVDVYGLLNGGVPTAAIPQINPPSESVTASVQVSIVDTTSGASIIYTTDGSTPTATHGTTYNGAFTVSSTATVKAIATGGGFASSGVSSAIYTIQPNPASSINFASGMSASGLTLSGSAAMNGSRLRLTDTRQNLAGSGFASTAVNIQSFTTDFNFQLTGADSDGFTFTIHGGATPAALGPSGGGLGYGPDTLAGAPGIPTSIAVKFDLANNAGEGPNSTGEYENGVSPTMPSVDLTASGVDLHSGDTMNVHMTYDGATLTWTITDSTANKTFTTSKAVNIPSLVGGNTAYVGFTGGTGGLTAIQEIIGWSYVSGLASQSQAPMPTFNPNGGTITTSQTIAISDTAGSPSIFYTTDGTTPSTSVSGSTKQYSSPFTLPASSSTTVKAIATASGFSPSLVASATYAVQGSSTPSINFSNGFAGQSTLSFSGGATINGSRLRITDGGGAEARSAFFNSPVNVQSFTNDFSFQITTPFGDGFTFTIHGGATPAALGPPGGGLGYGPDTAGGTPGIPSSVAVKFDLYSNAGEGPNSTGEYENGVSPTMPSVDLTASGVNLHSGDIMNVHMTYDGATLTWTITDSTTSKTFTTSKAVNIPALVGGNTAFVGFTGGTGGSAATQEILVWTYIH